MEKGKATRKKCKNRIVVAVAPVAAATVALAGVAAVVAVVVIVAAVVCVAVAISGLRASWNLECLAG